MHKLPEKKKIEPVPETAKWEEKILGAMLKNIDTQLHIAILVADSLGKHLLMVELEHVKRDVKFLHQP